MISPYTISYLEIWINHNYVMCTAEKIISLGLSASDGVVSDDDSDPWDDDSDPWEAARDWNGGGSSAGLTELLSPLLPHLLGLHPALSSKSCAGDAQGWKGERSI